jgi:predicted MPP superfamily phosphohydrolase
MRCIANEQKSDLMIMTGDWVNFRPDEMSVILPDVQKLTASLGVYGSLGNHDHYQIRRKASAFKRWDIRRHPV